MRGVLHKPMGKCPPPNGVSQVGICWEQSQQLYDLVQKVLLDVLATDPTALPQPPAVVDGSFAAPGVVGEVWSASTNGNWQNGGSNTVAPGMNYVVPNLPLPAGDWDVQWQMILPSNAAGSAGVGAALVRLGTPLPVGAFSNMQGYAVNIPTNTAPAGDPTIYQPLVVTGPSTPISINPTQGLVFNLFVWPSGVIASLPYTFNVWGRRRR